MILKQKEDVPLPISHHDMPPASIRIQPVLSGQVMRQVGIAQLIIQRTLQMLSAWFDQGCFSGLGKPKTPATPPVFYWGAGGDESVPEDSDSPSASRMCLTLGLGEPSGGLLPTLSFLMGLTLLETTFLGATSTLELRLS